MASAGRALPALCSFSMKASSRLSSVSTPGASISASSVQNWTVFQLRSPVASRADAIILLAPWTLSAARLSVSCCTSWHGLESWSTPLSIRLLTTMLYSSSLAPAHTHSCHLPVCFLQLVGFNICSSALGSLIVLGRCLGVGGCVGVECCGFPSELSLLPAVDELRPQASLKTCRAQ